MPAFKLPAVKPIWAIRCHGHVGVLYRSRCAHKLLNSPQVYGAISLMVPLHMIKIALLLSQPFIQYYMVMLFLLCFVTPVFITSSLNVFIQSAVSNTTYEVVSHHQVSVDEGRGSFQT